jgi:hypothetical protein
MDWTGVTNNPSLNSVYSILVYGDVTLAPTMSFSGTPLSGQYIFAIQSTCNLTSNGVNLGSGNRIVCSTNSSELILQDDLTCSGLITFGSAGTAVLTTNNHNITCARLWGDFNYAKIWNLGSSVINCTNISANRLDTVSANTATINISGTGECNLADVNWNGTSFNLTGSAHTISGTPIGIDTITLKSDAIQAITITAGSVIKCTTATLDGDASHAHTIESGTAGTLAQIWATNKSDYYVTYTDILRNYNGVVVSNCSGSGGGTFAGAGGHLPVC